MNLLVTFYLINFSEFTSTLSKVVYFDQLVGAVLSYLITIKLTGCLIKVEQVSSLNQRLFMIRRLRNSLNYSGLRKVADSLFISKIRYGLQLMGEIRWSNEESESVALGTIQKSQNKLLRFLNGTSLKDKVSNKSMLEKHNMLSINQLNAQIKLTEIWKAVKDENHPFKIQIPLTNPEERVSRGQAAGYIKTKALSNVTKKTFINDSIKAWNCAP